MATAATTVSAMATTRHSIQPMVMAASMRTMPDRGLRMSENAIIQARKMRALATAATAMHGTYSAVSSSPITTSSAGTSDAAVRALSPPMTPALRRCGSMRR